MSVRASPRPGSRRVLLGALGLIFAAGCDLFGAPPPYYPFVIFAQHDLEALRVPGEGLQLTFNADTAELGDEELITRLEAAARVTLPSGELAEPHVTRGVDDPSPIGFRAFHLTWAGDDAPGWHLVTLDAAILQMEIQGHVVAAGGQAGVRSAIGESPVLSRIEVGRDHLGLVFSQPMKLAPGKELADAVELRDGAEAFPFREYAASVGQPPFISEGVPLRTWYLACEGLPDRLGVSLSADIVTESGSPLRELDGSLGTQVLLDFASRPKGNHLGDWIPPLTGP